MDEQMATNPAERRRHPRTHIRMSLRCIRLDPDGGDVTDTLDMMDISRGGMGARCERSFYPGQRIVLALPLAGERGRRNVYATVVRCRPDAEGYNLGLEFEPVTTGAWYGSASATALAA
ncbi:MAG: PilZ domain-containing protein [Phycisphaerae bacterium]